MIVRRMQASAGDLVADDLGQWAAHCHNIHLAEAGIMTILSYEE